MGKASMTTILVVIFGTLTLIFLASTIFLVDKNTKLTNEIKLLQQTLPAPTPQNIYDKDAPAKVDCSLTKDNTCPQWCAPGSDYDCCIRAGRNWIEGRGCY
jgi:hypothetical protein